MKTDYEYIVLGCGGIGSATAYWLARRKSKNVLGIEQFEHGHHHGGSQDHSRIIRLTYYYPQYIRLAPASYTAWHTLEEESGVQMVFKTGSIQFSPVDHPYRYEIDKYTGAMDETGVPYDRVDADEIAKRFPQFRLKYEVDGIYQADTGLVDASRGNATHVAMARYRGATMLDNCEATRIRPTHTGVTIETKQGNFSCRKLIVTAGAWTDRLLASVNVNLSLTVTQEQVTYYATPNLPDFAIGKFPIFISHADESIYGFPIYGEVATKVGIDASGPAVTTDTRTYQSDAEREHRQEAWLKENIPGFLGPKLYTKTCLYTMPKDRHFVIDTLPEHPQIIVCVGAGHAYKFSGILGKILSELAIDGHTDYPIEPFALQRDAITDPNFKPVFRM